MAKFKVLHAAVTRKVDGNFMAHRAGEIVEFTRKEAERLLGLKAVAPVNDAGEVTAMPEPDPVSPHIENQLEDPSDSAGKHAAPEPADDDAADAGSTPRGNASLEEWQAFAKANGATDEQLAGQSRDQVRDMFGSASA